MTFREHLTRVAQAIGLMAVSTAKAPTVPRPRRFFEALKPGLFRSLTQRQVDGINVILDATAHWPLADRAYALATAYHETNRTMQPIKEYGGTAYYTRMYDIRGERPHVARRLGNIYPGDGAKFAGRGYPQLTGRANYAKANKFLHDLGVLEPRESLLKNPDLMLRADVAAAVMVYGMEHGVFTGADLDDDLPRSGPATLEEFILSRDIINVTDKASKIAREAIMFQAALIAGGVE